MKLSLVALCFMLTSFASFAKLGKENGFSGEIAFNTFYAGSTSNLENTDDEYRQRDGDTPQNKTFSVFPLGNAQYTFGEKSNHQLFLGTTRSDIAIGTFALEFGYKSKFDSGAVWEFALLPTILKKDVWEDPYQENGLRDIAKEGGVAYRVTINNIAGSLFSLDLGYGHQNIDDEYSGSELTNLEDRAKLDRHGDLYYGKFKMMLPLSKKMLLFPSLIYSQQETDGDAMKNRGYGTELSSIMPLGKHSIVVTLGYMKRNFDGENPIFDDITREDNEWKSFIAYEYSAPFDINNLSFITFSGYNKTTSNIDFYESEGWISSVGVNWKF